MHYNLFRVRLKFKYTTLHYRRRYKVWSEFIETCWCCFRPFASCLVTQCTINPVYTGKFVFVGVRWYIIHHCEYTLLYTLVLFGVGLCGDRYGSLLL